MKAIKLTKIIWDLSGVDEYKREIILNTLPKEKGFTASDEFNVPERVPEILKKKYGYDIVNCSFTECHIANTVDELLYLCAIGKEKPLYKAGGKLSSYGETALANLKSDMMSRKKLELEGKDEYDMPKHLDEVMLGVENVSGLCWDGKTIDELLKPIMSKIWDKRAENLKDAYDYMMEEEYE